ncbi:hypothetical protein GCM10010269_51160 [Streptomyces humidus]|uniref:Uncharacterized protein n=1 Tax=Streptomyces humidus TaxID=52259 RepID=A0A918L5X4_9ACTN|nr:hypothetical protein GCM10010269_51160 [Streptomyces humidus]
MSDVVHGEGEMAMKEQADSAEERRRDRFGALPERVRPQDMVEERPATPRDPARDAYNPEEFMVRYRTLAQCSTLQGGGVGHPAPGGPEGRRFMARSPCPTT